MREVKVEAERSSVSVAEARDLILAAVPALGRETVGLERAIGRVLAEEIRAGHSIPPEDNSAMDGYALRAADAATPPALLRVVDDLPPAAQPAPLAPEEPGS
jgi:molybdopterin molybdotransferase